jgi:hypothetical protein
MGFEPTIPVFEKAKTVHALDRAAAVIGIHRYIKGKGKAIPVTGHGGL